ncbi:late embryogenesis abundant (LEA)-like protein [Trifolium medium]|uniref:Late embryogenesis abundant (LEA)-like protein n=1 Tax=Trifolium medium TaxID=97028 RepID=A0A392R8J0_9FABA|nr:late embryogenesis abundant (LEA)-like protein [Trifolium medium]
MPIMGGGKEYETTSLFSPDCSVARFVGNNEFNDDIVMVEDLALPSLSCTSGIDGAGVVCRR